MTFVALKALWGRKLRTLLTMVAIVLGVATVSGTYVLTDSISSAFDSIFQGIYRGTDAAITGVSALGDSGGAADVPSSAGPPSSLARCRAAANSYAPSTSCHARYSRTKSDTTRRTYGSVDSASAKVNNREFTSPGPPDCAPPTDVRGAFARRRAA